MHLNVYVPKLAAVTAIQPGAGIIGSQRADHPGKLLIDYEDNRAGAINIQIMWNQFCQARGSFPARVSLPSMVRYCPLSRGIL